MTDEQLSALEAAARAATPGEWFTDRPEVDRFDPVTGHYTTPDRMHVISRVKHDGHDYAIVAITDGEMDESNAAYIAAANPAAVLALIQRVREAEGHRNDKASALTELLAAAEECASDLACHVNSLTTENDRRLYDSERRRHETDMAPVRRLRAAVARVRGE